MLQTQRQNQLKQVNKSVIDTLARLPLGRVQLHKIGHFGQTRIVVALLVALPWSACFSFSDYKAKAQYPSVGSVFEIQGETGDDPPTVLQILTTSGSGFKSPATDGH